MSATSPGPGSTSQRAARGKALAINDATLSAVRRMYGYGHNRAGAFAAEAGTGFRIKRAQKQRPEAASEGSLIGPSPKVEEGGQGPAGRTPSSTSPTAREPRPPGASPALRPPAGRWVGDWGTPRRAARLSEGLRRPDPLHRPWDRARRPGFRSAGRCRLAEVRRRSPGRPRMDARKAAPEGWPSFRYPQEARRCAPRHPPGRYACSIWRE